MPKIGHTLVSTLTLKRTWPWFATALLLAWIDGTQEQILVNGGAGWDGSMYLAMAKGAEVMHPYRLRIAYPWLATIFGGEQGPLAGFSHLAKWLGCLYGLGSAFALRRMLPGATEVGYMLGWAMLNFSELSPLRQAYWYPTNTDIPADCLFLWLLWAVVALPQGRLRDINIALALALGTTVRENFAFNYGMVLIFDFLRFEADGLRVRLSGMNMRTMAFGAFGLGASFCTIRAVCGDWPTAHKGAVAWGLLQQQRVAVIVGAALLVYAAPMLLALSGWGVPRVARLGGSTNLGVFFALTLPVAVVGGGDTERFFYWYMALLVVILLPTIDGLWRAQQRTLLFVSMAAFFVGHRAYTPVNPAGLLSGCAASDFFYGTSPYLGSYTGICNAATVREWMMAFALAAVLVLLRKARWEVVLRAPRGVPNAP
jgi:hypothetical protein